MLDTIYEEYIHKHGDYDLEESKEARRAFDEYLESLDIGNDQKIELDNRVLAVISQFEKQGFYHGFGAGLDLAREIQGKL